MAQAIEIGKPRRGFTLIELVIVMMIILILAAIAIPLYQTSVKRAEEVTLKTNLYHLRDAINQYAVDRKASPQSLEDLIDRGYFREIPFDPITKSQNTWQLKIDVSPVGADSSQTGVVDIESGSSEISPIEGTPYNSW